MAGTTTTKTITPGKLAGMKAVSNDRGVIAAAAMDQRGSLKKAIAKEKGADIGDKEMEEFKAHVTEVLTKHASAILLRSEEHTSELQSLRHLVCRLLLEKKK